MNSKKEGGENAPKTETQENRTTTLTNGEIQQEDCKSHTTCSSKAFMVAAEADNIAPNDLDSWRDFLGRDVTFIPVEHGTKKPIGSGWQKRTVADYEDDDYINRFENNNIGVLVGKSSGGLCAIDIDDDAQVTPFLDLNPELQHTFQTKGARGVQIWVRVKGEFPALAKLKTGKSEKWGEWRADGGQSVVFGQHPSGCQYQIVCKERPIEIAFDDIHWPDDLVWPSSVDDNEIIPASAVGPAYKKLDNGAVQINNLFWVSKYIEENTVVFDSTLGEFFKYHAESGLWMRTTEDTIKRDFVNELRNLAEKPGFQSLYFKINATLASNLVDLLRTMAERPDVFAKRPTAIHVKNGMLVFNGDELTLKTFSPDYYSRNRCPFAFDDTAECPRFIKELLQSALGDDDIELMQKWAGACLLGRNAAQRFLLMMGTPNGGKSTFMNVLEAVIGTQNVTQIRTENLTSRFELFGFVGKTLLTGKDVPADFLLNKNAQVIKALVGNDQLSTEKKGQAEPVPIRGDFNLGVTCNANLNVRLEGDVGAYRRRMLVVRYEKEAPKRRIPDFADKLLEEEGAGILRWMVEGAIKLQRDLLEHGDFKLTARQKERIDELLAESDSVRYFVDNRVSKKAGNALKTQDLQSAYFRCCEERGWAPMPAREVSRQLPEAMLEIHHVRQRHDLGEGKSIRGYIGVGFKAKEEEEHEED